VEQRHRTQRDGVQRRPRRRLHIPHELSDGTAALFEGMLRQRLLPLISQELPAVEVLPLEP
jgi:hypothetical protein